MLIADALLTILLCAGLLSFLETVSRRFWATRWEQRGYSASWSQHRPTVIRLAASSLTAALTGIAFHSVYAAAAFAALAWLAALAVSTDLANRKIPSEPVWTVLWMSLFALSAEQAFTGSVNGNPLAFTDFIIAEAVVLGVMLVMVIVTVGGIGSGDVRLVAALTTVTAWTGAGSVLVALMVAAVGFLVTRRLLDIPLAETAGDGEPVPYAPGLVAGYAATTLATVAIALSNTPTSILA